MSRRDSRREAEDGPRASPGRSAEFREFWEHPGRSRKRAAPGGTRRPGSPETGSGGRSGTLAPERPRPERRAAPSPEPRPARRPDPHADRRPDRASRPDRDSGDAGFVPGVFARARSQGKVRPAPLPKGLSSMRRTSDGMTVGAIAIGFVVGLSLLAMVENEVLRGGPGEPAGAKSTDGTPVARADPGRSAAPGPRKRAPRAPAVNTLGKHVGDLTEQLRGPAAKQSYGADKPPLTGPIRFSGDRTWAFGTTAIPVPADRTAMPLVGLYVAQWTGDRWRIALSGTAEFDRVLRRAPAQLLPPAERRVLARYSAVSGGAAARPTGLMLPWQVGGSWRMDATAGDRGPFAAVSFSGDSAVVQAAGPGRMYRFCATEPGRGLVMVIHPNGIATTYYHLAGVARIRDGGPVRRGQPLGRIGTDRPCGGAPVDAAQVRFAMRRGSEEVPFAGVELGGWIFRERADPLLGWAEHGPNQAMPGAELRNYGPVPAPSAETPAPGPSQTPDQGGTKPSPSPSSQAD